ncbi:hypothetical protein Y717_10655 [Streptomyces scopuliridis RB72]|uniref:Uncharacterized protein n=2 Tax=Streptomyces scopuliridis TaxID=452529 RepID=A0A2T7SP02_9ACTN|nr:hypothetical protein Y717_10655 [Streptomyces scopuliridis RB72]
MGEWINPRYAEVMARYRTAKSAAGEPKRRSGWSKRPYGDPFVIVVDPTTLAPYTTGR